VEPIGSVPLPFASRDNLSKGLVVAPQPYRSAPLYLCEYGNKGVDGPQQRSPLLAQTRKNLGHVT
jgi:hypothetical protein